MVRSCPALPPAEPGEPCTWLRVPLGERNRRNWRKCQCSQAPQRVCGFQGAKKDLWENLTQPWWFSPDQHIEWNMPPGPVSLITRASVPGRATLVQPQNNFSKSCSKASCPWSRVVQAEANSLPSLTSKLSKGVMAEQMNEFYNCFCYTSVLIASNRPHFWWLSPNVNYSWIQ